MTYDKSIKNKIGFTLIEVVAVIAIIGMLLALLLPAVQSAREAVRRITCLGRMRQIGIASANFESALQRFQPGYIGSTQNRIDDMNCTWIGSLAFILPYIDQSELFSKIESVRDVSINASAQNTALPRIKNWWNSGDNFACQEVARNRVPSFECPSDPQTSSLIGVIAAVHAIRVTPTRILIARELTPFERAQGISFANYAGASGFSGEGLSNLGSRRGVLFNRSKTKCGDIVDGTTNTILYGELTGEWEVSASGRKLRTHKFPWIGIGAIPALQGLGTEQGFDRFGSFHSSGLVSFLFADGSTRSLPVGVDLSLFVALVTVANSEVTEIE